jgi:surfeit locus 1 family protein
MIARIKNYPWLSFFTFGAFIVLCGLSYWQIERMVWKKTVLENMASVLNAPPVTIQKASDFVNLPEFQRVSVKGVLLHAENFHLQARYYKGALGFHLITPFKLADGSVIFLNRGWVPKDYQTNPKVKITQPDGIISVTAMVRGKEHPRSYLPQNDPSKGLWLWQDADAWATSLKDKQPKWNVVPIFVQQLSTDKTNLDFPLPQESHFSIPNDHLEYAITWGSLALILLVVYGIKTRSSR